MLSFLPASIRGALVLTMMGVNTVVLALPIYGLALLKLVAPTSAARRRCEVGAIRCAEVWVAMNGGILASTQTTVWDVRGADRLRREGRFLVCSNHQSWADVLVLQGVFGRRIPFLKFFLKRELIWVPVLGLAWWALDFPFMKRYTREYLAEHPEDAGKDMETTRRMCERFRLQPVSVINFLEGTRFSDEKRSSQGSAYNHLLRPKAGGVAFALGAMGDTFESVLDVTIVYAGRRPTMWYFLCGRVPRIIVDVRERQVPAELVEGDYAGDTELRGRVQRWVNALWADKDELIGRLNEEAAS